MPESVSVVQPIFVVGAPRSGTTILLDFLTAHPDTAWIDHRLDANPSQLQLARKLRCYDWPLLGEFWFERRFFWKSLPEPAENTGFWTYWMPGFDPPDDAPRPPGPEDVSEAAKEATRHAVDTVCELQGRKLFVGQHTGFPRIALLRSVFPEARFIQCLRDPRSVAWWLAKRISKDPEFPLWAQREAWRKALPKPLQERLNTLDFTPLNLAGVVVRWFHQLYRAELAQLPPTHHREVAYSDLLGKTPETIHRVFRWLGLRDCKRIETYLRYHGIRERNQRSRKVMTPQEADQLDIAVAG